MPSEALLRPAAIGPGDRLRIIAPSGPFDRTLVLRGMGWLKQRYRIDWDPSMFERQGYLAGSDERRRAELDRALRAKDVAAIVAARGGYGLTRILHLCDFRALRERPKWIVGFSDITALHLEAARVGVASMHAHNAAGLGRGDAHGRERWLQALEHPEQPLCYERLIGLREGRARGVLIGGNLTLLSIAAASGRLRLPPCALLVLEDVGESSYRVDRMLSALLVSGAFDQLSGVILGDFTDCPPGRFGVRVEDVLAERLGALRIPIAAALPFGHGRRNDPLPLGVLAELDASQGTLTVGPA